MPGKMVFILKQGPILQCTMLQTHHQNQKQSNKLKKKPSSSIFDHKILPGGHLGYENEKYEPNTQNWRQQFKVFYSLTNQACLYIQ